MPMVVAGLSEIGAPADFAQLHQQAVAASQVSKRYTQTDEFRLARRRVNIHLRKLFDLPRCRFHDAGFQIAYAVEKSKHRGQLLYAGGHTVQWDPDTRRAATALAELAIVLPKLISSGRETERDLRQRLEQRLPVQLSSDLNHFTRRLDDLDTFLKQVEVMAASFQAPTSKSHDPRSAWHKTARLFARWIEDDLAKESITVPTRNSAASPLVIAVKDFLEWAGQSQTDAAVRKALAGKPRQS